MHLARARHFQPAARQGPGLKLNVDLGAGLGEGKKAGAKAQHQVVRLKKGTAKIGEDNLQVFEADVLAYPQAFALVEHGRMRGVAVHAVSAARSDHADLGHQAASVNQGAVFFDMLHGVADLHRAGVGAQQVGRGFGATFNIKGVVHGARRMVFRRVERREVEPIGLNLGALGHVKAHGAKDRLDTLQRERHRVQSTRATLPSG